MLFNEENEPRLLLPTPSPGQQGKDYTRQEVKQWFGHLLTPAEKQHLGLPIPTLGVRVLLLIPPRPAERPRFSKFGGTYNSKAYSDYKKRLIEAIQAKILEGKIPAGDYAALDATFYLPVPKSWSRREKAEASGQLHRKKPDADNYLKALSDALEEAGVFRNDGQVAQMKTSKWYVEGDAEPRIEFDLLTYEQLMNK